MRREVSAPETEPEQKRFKLPSEGIDHLFQVVEVVEEQSTADKIAIKLKVVEGGEESGRSMLHWVSTDSEWKGFFTTRLFLKAIREPYKGKFVIDDDMWIGKTFEASVVHSQDKNNPKKIYANIDQYNLDTVEEVEPKTVEPRPVEISEAEQRAWDEER